MADAALSYTYRYAFPSQLATTPLGSALRLATCSGPGEHPCFFKGRMARPKQSADLLRGITQIVQARFHIPPAMLSRILALADPVVTSNENVLRFEAFSTCCSTYARADFLSSAIDGELLGRGTTNVDFGAAVRSALARVRDSDQLDLSVGADGVELSTDADQVIERKVALPVRWLKGFVEVQAYQAKMKERLAVDGAEAHRFLRSIPKIPMSGTIWVTAAGRGLRLSQRQTDGAVPVGGVHRLRVLEELSIPANRLRIYSDKDSHASAWELSLDGARFCLVLSPEVARGFSGEGQVLSDLAGSTATQILPRIQASLKWQSIIDPDSLASTAAVPRGQVNATLSVLGSRGLVGYDLAEGAYFHRELPFDFSLVESLHPRLKEARKLVAEAKVHMVRRNDDCVEAFVGGTDVEHHVTMSAGEWKCTCRWYAKHRSERGPCKHVLATQLTIEV
jgi:hypothetical protein